MNSEFLRNFVNLTFDALYVLILIRVLLSWIPQVSNNVFGRFVFEITEPILGTIRKILPKTGFIDLSPIIAFLLLQFLENLVSRYI